MQVQFSILWLVLLTTILLIPTVVPNTANPVAWFVSSQICIENYTHDKIAASELMCVQVQICFHSIGP